MKRPGASIILKGTHIERIESELYTWRREVACTIKNEFNAR